MTDTPSPAPETGLPKTFDPATIEARWAKQWEERGLFRPHRPDATPFTIVNPPPNVTGALHIGHALDNTLQDVVVRYERLRGKDALWVVGTDHAGIATQMVVERQLEAKQDKRTNYSRDEFVAKVWEWKAESGGTITSQLRRLGCSMDWSREQFTMDPHFTKAVVKVFVDLHNQGLIYRDKRLVNWDPKLKTAISDLEVESREVQGHMWHFKYPLEGGQTYRYVERDADGNIIVDEQRDYISIATTRPETMLGDGAVAVHPDDARYAPIVGKFCEIPVGPKEHRRLIPIITDEYPDPEFGSGAVKITGAHDENDFAVAQRAGIPMFRLMDEAAAMRSDGAPYAQAAERARAIARGSAADAAEIDAMNLVPDNYRGLDRFAARAKVVADIDAEGLMIGVEDKVIAQPFGDRGGVVIEPMLMDQWYVNAAELAKAPLEAVRSGAIEIVPKTWEKTFFNWMENIQPWCVSRQLWWGHRIPAWHLRHYRTDGETGTLEPVSEIIVDHTLESAYEQIEYRPEYADGGGPLLFVYDSMQDAEARWLKDVLESPGPEATKRSGVVLVEDPDVLDTWFSSALWPFATLGWPEERPSRLQRRGRSAKGAEGVENVTDTPHPNPTPEGEGLLRRHYPNSLLISGFDILFFWDARMMMMGQAMTGQNPWPRLYLHGLVRAPDGQKMSKSKGNVVDPLGLIDQYGADALRFFMAAMESQGRDIKMDERRVEGYRNFATKLWNAARFCQSNGIGASTSLAAPVATSAVNRWIIGEVVETLAELDKAMADLRFDAAANAIYHFVWDQFCDWYIELIKGAFDEETKAVAGWVLDQILVMLHPFMPFVTEELWTLLGDRANYPLITAKWPEPGAIVDAEAKAEVEWLIGAIGEVRATKVALDAAAKPMAIFVSRAKQPQFDWLNNNLLAFKRMTRAQTVNVRTAAGLIELGHSAKGLDLTIDKFVDAELAGEVQLVLDGVEGMLDFFGDVNLADARTRLTKALEAATKEAKSLEGRLNNASFVEKAKPEAVEKARTDHAHHTAEAERLAAALARLG